MISEQYILVAQVKDVTAQTVNLKVSTDGSTFQQAIVALFSMRGKQAAFRRKAALPTELEEKSYTVLDASEGPCIVRRALAATCFVSTRSVPLPHALPPKGWSCCT